MVLSKSNYMAFLRHPAWLWLEKHDKEKLPAVDENTQAIFDAGNLFETYAEKLFPEGVILGYKTNGHFDTQKYFNLPKLTEEALKRKEKVIFQGRCEIDDITCTFDVLQRNDSGSYNLYEIKSSTEAKPEHEHDLAFQVTVLERCGLRIAGVYVIHVNGEYVRHGDIQYRELSDVTEVTSAVRTLLEETAENIEKAKVVMTQNEIPDISPRHARNGSFGAWLQIYKTLRSDLDQYSIYHLCSSGARRIAQFENEGIETIFEIPEDAKVTTKQQHQILATKRGERIIRTEEIRTFLQMFKFPLYFLDYETFIGVVPAFDGLRPYQQVPFQYSLHILETPDGELKHTEYLHEENTLSVQPLVSQLKKDIGPEGSVIVWNQGFEKSCNVGMTTLAPEYNSFLYDVNDRIVDLMISFAEGWYVDKDFFGSASIKNVLPVLVPALSYKELAIHGGSTAQRLWMEAVLYGHHEKEKEQILHDLRRYCGLDTLAMVEIWRVLNSAISR